MTDVAAASLALREVSPGAIVILEPYGGHQFPNGVVADTEVELPVVARRWWNPNCSVVRFEQERVAQFLSRTEFPKLPMQPEACVGWGPGLTPAGDDVILGMLITFHALGEKILSKDLYAICRKDATTAYSFELLTYASRGQVARPVLQLMETLAGFGDLDRAIYSLSNFGATSGGYVMEGVRLALNTAFKSEPV